MQRIRQCTPGGSGQAAQPLRERRKAVLTCLGCAHTSSLDDDWCWIDCNRGTEIRCPDCDQLLTVRAKLEDNDTPK